MKIWLALAGTVFFLAGPHWTVYAESGFGFLAALAAIFCVGLWWFRGPSTLKIDWIHGLLFAALIWLTAVTLFRGEGYNGLYLGLRHAALGVVFWLVSQGFPRIGARDIGRAFGVVLLLFGLLYLVGGVGGLGFGRLDLERGSRLSLTFGNPNLLAAVLVLINPVVFALALVAHGGSGACEGRRNLWLWAAFLAGCGILLLTGSRNGLVFGIGGSALVFLFWYRWAWGKWLGRVHGYVFAALACVLLVWGGTLGRGTVEKMFQLLTGGGASEMGRLTAWSIAWERIIDSVGRFLAGSGWGALYPLSMTHPGESLVFRLDSTGFRHAHNEYLEIWLEGGLIGLLLVVSALGLLLMRSLPGLRQIKDTRERVEWLGLIVGLMGFAAFATFSVAPRYSVVLLPAAIVAGALLHRFGKFREFGSASRGIAAAIILIVVLGFAYESGRRFVSGMYFAKHMHERNTYMELKSRESEETETGAGSENEMRRHLNKSFAAIDRAIQAHPGRVKPRFRKFALLVSDGGAEHRREIEASYHELSEVFPNYGNAPEFYAYYLASQLRFREAADTIRNLADLRYYNLGYLGDELFYRAAMSDHAKISEICTEFLFRAFQAEATAADSNILSVRRLGPTEVSLRFREAGDGGDRTMTLGGAQLARQIPSGLFQNRPHLKQYLLSAVYRTVVNFAQPEDKPRFFDTLAPRQKKALWHILGLDEKKPE